MGHFLYVELPVDTLVPDCVLCVFFPKGLLSQRPSQLVTTDSPMVSNCFRLGGFHPRVHAGYQRLSQLRQEQRRKKKRTIPRLRMISRSKFLRKPPASSVYCICIYIYIYIYEYIFVHVLHNGVPLLFLIFKKWRNHHFPVSATAPDGANFGLSFSRWRQGFSRDLARLKLEIQTTNNSIQLGYSWFMSS